MNIKSQLHSMHSKLPDIEKKDIRTKSIEMENGIEYVFNRSDRPSSGWDVSYVPSFIRSLDEWMDVLDADVNALTH